MTFGVSWDTGKWTQVHVRSVLTLKIEFVNSMTTIHEFYGFFFTKQSGILSVWAFSKGFGLQGSKLSWDPDAIAGSQPFSDNHLLEVRLQFVLGIIRLVESGAEGVVDAVELAPHGVGAVAQQRVDLPAQARRRLALPLRARDVLLRELRPRMRNRHPGE